MDGHEKTRGASNSVEKHSNNSFFSPLPVILFFLVGGEGWGVYAVQKVCILMIVKARYDQAMNNLPS